LKYQPPWGTDPNGNAPYINGNPAEGVGGSIPPAAVFEYPQRELLGVIEKSGIVPSDGDLLQLAKSIRSQALNYAIDTGVADALLVAYDPPITAYTAGLTLHVRVRATNNGPTSINAGPGIRQILKMNGAVLGAADLPVGGIATFVYDGTAFQLSNFGGSGGGGTDITLVNIPYAEDSSPVANEIRVTYPLPSNPAVGNVVAVKVANTATGPTMVYIDAFPGVPARPNGGGDMLYGDWAAGDVVQFFFDGNFLYFPPNPELNSPETYTIGPDGNQQYLTVAAAMADLKRKTIGSEGSVTLEIVETGNVPLVGPIVINHPNGDRITVKGVMIGAPPTSTSFVTTGNTPALRAQDAINNQNMLRQRYGTEIRIPANGTALLNTGPGQVTFRDLLIVGAELPMPPLQTYWTENGVGIGAGHAASLINVSVWGAQVGFNNGGAMHLNRCYATWCSHCGFSTAGASIWTTDCGAISNGNYGLAITFGSGWSQGFSAQVNAGIGVYCDNGSGAAMWWGLSQRNGLFDLQANIAASLTWLTEAGGISGFATSSPAPNVVGNTNSVVAAPILGVGPRPPVSPLPLSSTGGVGLATFVLPAIASLGAL
jgi:hypothetical protein